MEHMTPVPCPMTAVIVDGYSTGNFLPSAFAALGVDVVHVRSTRELMPSLLQPEPTAYRKSFVVAEASDVPWVAAELAALGPVAVLAGQEPGVPLADTLSELLGLATNGSALSSARRDKYRMIETLRAAGLRCARQRKGADPQALAAWAAGEGGLPAVVKPLSSAAGDQVHICRTADEVAAAAGLVLSATDIFGSRNTEALAQSFLPGTEYVVDTVGVAGEHYVCGVWEYEKTTTDSGRRIYDRDVLLDPSAAPVPELIAYVREVLGALGILHGPAHAEVVMTPGGPALVEIGARLNGSMNPGFHDECLGGNQADLTALAYARPDLFLERHAGRVYTKRREAVVHNTRTARDGVVAAVHRPTVELIAALPTVYLVSVRLAPGKRLRPTADLLSSPLRIFMSGQDRESLRADHLAVQDLKDAVYTLEGEPVGTKDTGRTERRPLVLLLGADQHILEACGRDGVDAVVAWGATAYDFGLVPIPEGVTAVRVDDQASPEAVLMALHRAGLGDRVFDTVYTSDEWALVTAGVLAQYLGCRGIDPATAVHFRDKSLQKRRVAEAGLRTARVTVVEDVHDVSAITGLEYRRAVLKPVAGAATTRTTVVENLADLQQRSKQYREDRTAQRTFVLEEFVDGDEWIADGVVFGGELVFCALGTYGSPCLTVVDQGLPLSMRRFDPTSEAWAYELCEPFVRQAIAALGLRSGAFHMEFFRGRDDVLTFGECAARRGGGLIHEEVETKFNVHLGAATLRCALGRHPEPAVESRPETVGTTFLMGSPGTLVSCPSQDELMEQPGVVLARIEFPVGGQFAEGPASTDRRIGQVLVTADSEEGLQRRFAELREWFAERTVITPPGGNQRELRTWHRDTWPDLDFRDILWG